MKQNQKELKASEQGLMDTLKKIRAKIKDENRQMNEKLDKINELSEVVDKRVKRERSDIDIELRGTITKINNLQNKLSEVNEYENRSSNILIRIVESLKLISAWNLHEEEKYTDSAVIQNGGALSNPNKMSSNRKISMNNLNDEIQNRSKDFASVQTTSNKSGNGKSKFNLDHNTMRNQLSSSDVYPIKPTLPPIEYREVTLSKAQVYKVIEGLTKDCMNY